MSGPWIILAIPAAVFVAYSVSYLVEDARNRAKDRETAEVEGRVIVRDALTRRRLN